MTRIFFLIALLALSGCMSMEEKCERSGGRWMGKSLSLGTEAYCEEPEIVYD